MNEVKRIFIFIGPGLAERLWEVCDAIGLFGEKLRLDVTAKVLVFGWS